MKEFKPYLDSIENLEHRKAMEDVFEWINKKFPKLDRKIAWNQPMYTDHGTFIIGFSVSKAHFSIAVEDLTLNLFSKEIIDAGYDHSKKLFKIRFDQKVNYKLLEKLIKFNIKDKKNCDTFWRKP